MAISSLVQVLESPLVAHILVLAVLSALFLYIRSKEAEGHSAVYLYSLGFLAARSLAYAFFPYQELFFLTDVAYLCFFMYIFMMPCKVARSALFPSLALNAVVAALFALRLFTDVAVGVPGWLFRLVLVLDALLVLIFAFIRRKVRKETIARQIVGKIWPVAVPIVLVYVAAGMILGYEDAVFQGVVAPVSYLWYVAAILATLRAQDDQLIDAVSYYEGSIDSLYNMFLSTGTVLKGDFTMDQVMGAMNEAFTAETAADGGVIFLVDEFDDLIVCKAYTGSFPPPVPLPENLPRKQNRVESFMKHAQFRLGEGLFGDIAKTGKNVYIPSVEGDARITLNGEEDFLKLRSLMAVPLMVEERIIGVAAMARKSGNDGFTEAEFDRFKLLANFGTLTISNFFSFLAASEKSGIERSAGIAAEIQKSIIPKKIPQFPSLGVGAFTIPAPGVSGDYFDVIQTRADRVVCVVGDVAGKGVSAALIMVMIRSILHLITNTNKDIATVLNWVNKGITGKIELDHYATLGIVAVNVVTGEMEYANASHQPVLVYRRASDSIESLELKSVPIGVERTTEYGRKALRLSDGDIVVLYTDGIIEAMNEQGKQYGRRGLSQVVTRNRDLAPKEIVAKIKSDLSAFVGSVRQHDDQTVLVLKMKL